jgi:hypothetical protein
VEAVPKFSKKDEYNCDTINLLRNESVVEQLRNPKTLPYDSCQLAIDTIQLSMIRFVLSNLLAAFHLLQTSNMASHIAVLDDE